MIEKVNPKHPDKIADRIAGAIVDLAYTLEENPKVAVEVLIGHDECNITIESSVTFEYEEIEKLVARIAGNVYCNIKQVPQDKHLANNQSKEIKCGDNGIFKGVPLTAEEQSLSEIARTIYGNCQSDGKYILANNQLIICQSNVNSIYTRDFYKSLTNANVKLNPLGDWTGGINVDTGATNRKLGSDMAQSVTGGGLHGKDLSKADVSLNIYCFLQAQKLNSVIEAYCAIGDSNVNIKIGNKSWQKIKYKTVVNEARKYILKIGGFEKFAEWGLF